MGAVKLPHTLGGIEPGAWREAQVLERLGDPESRLVTPPSVTAGIETGGVTVLEYPSRGLFVLLDKHDPSTNPRVDAVYVTEPYALVDGTGLRLGMPEAYARAILEEHFHLANDWGDSLDYWFDDAPGDARLQVWFEDDELRRVKLFRPDD